MYSSIHRVHCSTEMVIIEFLLFVLTATLGGMFLCGANDLITIFVALECFSLCSYLLSRYTKKDVWSNEATMKYLFMGGASSSILVHGFSWLYGSSRGEIELQEIVMYHYQSCTPQYIAMLFLKNSMLASLKCCFKDKKEAFGMIFTLHCFNLIGRAVLYIKFAAMPGAMGISNTWCQNVFYLKENNEFMY